MDASLAISSSGGSGHLVMSLTGLMHLSYTAYLVKSALCSGNSSKSSPPPAGLLSKKYAGAVSWTPSLLRMKMLRPLSLSIGVSACGIWTPGHSI
jgi:hypothetical protein